MSKWVRPGELVLRQPVAPQPAPVAPQPAPQINNYEDFKIFLRSIAHKSYKEISDIFGGCKLDTVNWPEQEKKNVLLGALLLAGATSDWSDRFGQGPIIVNQGGFVQQINICPSPVVQVVEARVGSGGNVTINREIVAERYTPEKVKETMELLGLDEQAFASFIGAGLQTVKGWLNGKNLPSNMAARFMDELRGNLPLWRQRLLKS